MVRVGLWFALHYPDRLGKADFRTQQRAFGSIPGTIQEQPAEGRQLLRQRSMEAINNPTRETIRKKGWSGLMASPDRVTDELVEVRYRIYADPERQKALTDVFNNSASATATPGRFKFPPRD